MAWEDDDELEKKKFFKFPEGPSETEIASDGEKVRNSYGDAVVEFQTKDEQIMSIRPGQILDVLKAAKKKHGTLVGRTLKVTRAGTTKEDTRYTDISVE